MIVRISRWSAKRTCLISLAGLVAGMFCLFVYFFSTTPSDNTVSIRGGAEDVCYEPRGDSVYYSVMAVHFDHPAGIATSITSIHAKRILAPMLVHFLSYSALGQHKGHIPKFEFDYYKKGTFTDSGVLALYRIIERNFLLVNVASYLLASLFLFFVLISQGLKAPVSAVIVLMLSALPVYMRLYFGWPVMPDPLFLMFIAAFLFFMTRNAFLGAAITIGIGSLASEKMVFLLLVLVPYYAAFAGRNDKRMNWGTTLSFFLPLLPFVLLNINPIFGNLKPFADIGAKQTGTLYDFLSLALFHLKRYFIEDFSILKQVFVYFNCFGAFIYLFILFPRDFTTFVRKNKYWIPFVAVTMCYSFFVDRYVITLFPFVVLGVAHIAKSRLSKPGIRNIVFAAAAILAHLVATRFFLNGLNKHLLYRYYIQDRFNIFTTQLQVEYQSASWLMNTVLLHVLCFSAIMAVFYILGFRLRKGTRAAVRRKHESVFARKPLVLQTETESN